MSKLYSIQESTLTDIGDALRSKYGETRPATIQVPYVIAKSSNVTDLNNYGFMPSGKTYNVVRIPRATKIKVNLYYMTSSDSFGKVYVASGEYESNIPTDIKYSGQPSPTLVELEFDNTEVITFCLDAMYIRALGYYAECIGYDVDGNPIEVEGCSYKEQETEVKNTYSSADVATAIEGLETALPEEVFVITGNCSYRFAQNGWNWFIEKYEDKITTKDITNCQCMFHSCSGITNIPFDLNLKEGVSNNLFNLFYMSNITEAPRVRGNLPLQTSNYTNALNLTGIFYGCQRLRNIPADWFDSFGGDEFWASRKLYSGETPNMFFNCHSLRKHPNLDKLATSHTTPYSCFYSSAFYNCYTLNEIVDMPVCGTFTTNGFINTFLNCNRLKRITFKTNDDGSVQVANWKTQTIDLSGYIGMANSNLNIKNYNSGITADKEVTNETTYQALKNDPDWFATNINYSRYNHDSAVATINSLPDTSAYLATAGGTNTIKFNGASGALTDGGAINTLTEEEIAVATAKGWTVTLV